MNKGRESTQQNEVLVMANFIPVHFGTEMKESIQNRKPGWRQEREIYYYKRRSKHLVKCLKVNGSLIFTYKIG